MKNLIKMFAVIALFVAFACSKSEQNVPLIGSIDQLILTSSSEDEVLAANEEVTFTIVGNDGVDYSALATLSVNQEEVTGNNFVFAEEGTYEISASHLGTTSNTLTYNVVDSASFTIIINGTKFLRDQTVVFTLVNGEGEDITDEATFYVDGIGVSGSQFSSSTEGSFAVYAEYTAAGETFSTEEKSFEVFIPKRKVVVEDYTGTWCGFCPRVAAAILAVHEVTDFVTIVAIHKTAANSPDPMHFQDFETLED
ncbi:MAG: thiol-disulfide isomerase/thioredoxin, partial [Planctomycetota bacterium]